VWNSNYEKQALTEYNFIAINKHSNKGQFPTFKKNIFQPQIQENICNRYSDGLRVG
jgi:hypothetical protein